MVVIELRFREQNTVSIFLDIDPLPVYDPEQEQSPLFSGRRISQGGFRHIGFFGAILWSER